MPNVQISDQVFEAARRRAADAGFTSVEDYITEFVLHDQELGGADETPNLDHLFTPQRLAHIDRSLADAKSGKTYDGEQAAAELARRREKWLHENPG